MHSGDDEAATTKKKVVYTFNKKKQPLFIFIAVINMFASVINLLQDNMFIGIICMIVTISSAVLALWMILSEKHGNGTDG